MSGVLGIWMCDMGVCGVRGVTGRVYGGDWDWVDWADCAGDVGDVGDVGKLGEVGDGTGESYDE